VHYTDHANSKTLQSRITVAIETLVILVGEADPRDTAEAFSWADENYPELVSRWLEYSEEEP
jgi:hypothetical protein